HLLPGLRQRAALLTGAHEDRDQRRAFGRSTLGGFGEWNCRAGHNSVIIRTDGTVVRDLNSKCLSPSEHLAFLAGHLAEARLATIAGVKSDPNLGMTGTMFVNRLDAGGPPVLRSLPGTAPQSPDDRLRQPFATCDGCGS